MTLPAKPKRNISLSKNILVGCGIGGTGERARNKKGHYKKDDLSTTDVNEAYVDGRTPAERNKRARGAKGKFKADDKSTKKVNEAYKGGKAPKKKRGRPRKKK